MKNYRQDVCKAQIAEIELSYKPLVKLSTLPVIRSSKDIYELLKQTWDGNRLEFVEQFKVLLLNRANRLFGIFEASTGCSAGTIADPKLIFAAAIKSNACSIIICHNHPSGNTKPSSADEALTQKIKNAGGFLDIKLLDHLIITGEGYFSFADEGLL
jgi:DNA repair protein RadC